MDPRETQHVKQFLEALETWKDQRFVTRAQIEDASMFLLYLVNFAEHQGWVYRGHSWRESGTMGTLVVRSVVDEVPSVAFTSARTCLGGMRIFLRKMEADFLEWVPDRYG